MVRHIVMWKFKSGVDLTPAEAAETIKGKLESLKGQIPGLIDLEVGTNRNESKSSFDAVLTADFESWEALAAYKIHPLHVEIGAWCEYYKESRARVDYEK